MSNNFLHSFGNNLLQKYVNSNSIINLRNYYDNIRNSFQEVETKNQLDALVKRLEINKSFVEDSRPVELLHIVAQVSLNSNHIIILFYCCLLLEINTIKY